MAQSRKVLNYKVYFILASLQLCVQKYISKLTHLYILNFYFTLGNLGGCAYWPFIACHCKLSFWVSTPTPLKRVTINLAYNPSRVLIRKTG